MASHNENPWRSHLAAMHIAYDSISEELIPFNNYRDWPSLADYNEYSKKIVNKNNKQLMFVHQHETISEHYEEKIYQQGLVNTRLNNWHDFFNYTIWQAYPETKCLINALQHADYQEQQFSSKRTARQNYLAHFDESGMIILCSNKELIELLKQHCWKTLFWTYRKKLMAQMKFIVFGHAIYEKLLNPYVGLTAKSIVFFVDEAVLHLPNRARNEKIDQLLSEYLSVNLSTSPPCKLQPVPLLGIPYWSTFAQHEIFYDNVDYFRGKRDLRKMR